jgi:aryl-alcohol dehydrogenase-like predicted oxidoreductase
MRYVPYGRTGVEVSAIALGGHEYLDSGLSRGFNEEFAAAVKPGYAAPGYGGPRRQAVLRAAYDLGINLFDVTIDPEKEALGRNLADMPPPYPVYVQSRPEGMCYGYDEGNRKMLDYAALKAEVQRGLGLLRRETLDFLNIGLLNWSIDGTPDYLERLRDNLARLRQEGLIRFAVADSFSGQRLYLAEMESGAFDAVNFDLSIGEPAPLETVAPRARELGLGIICREVFFKSELFTIGESIGITDRAALAKAALAWVVRKKPDTILLGVDNADQLRANARTVESADDPMDEELLSRLTASEGFQAYYRKRYDAFLASERA